MVVRRWWEAAFLYTRTIGDCRPQWRSMRKRRRQGWCCPEDLWPVWDDLEAKNKQLLDELLRFYNSQLHSFQLSFESLIQEKVRRHIRSLET